MDLSKERCPECGHTWQRRNPLLTVDMIIVVPGEPSPRIVLVKRKNPPHGWALPGGFVDYGETVEEAAIREALEETGLEITIDRQFHSYSEPSRDPRGHMVSVVFLATAVGAPKGGDDASEAMAFSPQDLPRDIVFDHPQIIRDYLNAKY
ncbi:MAG: NUDIX hydrolase [Candidatus Eisenbacteria bacterium]